MRVGSTTRDPNPLPGSDLNGIKFGVLTLLAGAGTSDTLSVFDSGDTGPNTGQLFATALTGLGMDLGILYGDFELLTLALSSGNDNLFIESTHLNPVKISLGDETAIPTLDRLLARLHANKDALLVALERPDIPLHTNRSENDIRCQVTNVNNDVVNIRLIAGVTTIEGGAGNDLIRVNFNELGEQTFVNGIGAELNLHGQLDSDSYEIGLAGNGVALINVFDQSGGVLDDGVDSLVVFGTNEADFFLLRANRLARNGEGQAMVAAVEVDDNREPVENGAIERVNYDGDINGRFVIFGRDGDDTFVLDDNLSPTVIFGDAGDDSFQIGQIFASARDGLNNNNGLDPIDFFETTQTTRGFLSNGISQNTTLFGGFGSDNFTVFHNKAELFLFGDEDDDNFQVRAFVRVNPNDPNAPFTNINGGQGADFISFTLNAPVRIEGGDGFDTVTVVGTEFGDDFVITDKGVFGSGLFVTYDGVEKVVVDALEGNDRFFIASTSEKVVIQLVGGLGSDTFNVGGGNNGEAITVVSNGLEGHSGLIINTVTSDDADYNAIFVEDISATVADNDEPGAIVRPDQRQDRGLRGRRVE